MTTSRRGCAGPGRRLGVGSTNRRLGVGSTLVALALLAATGPAAAAPTPSDQDRVASARISHPGIARDYWTAARMRAARPAQILLDAGGETVPPPARRRSAEVGGESTAFSQRVHGKVFFTIAAGSQPGDYVCSATVVESNSHALVWTAGHCVNDAEFGGGFASKFVFVPGYRNGERPFGSWPARKLATTKAWRQDENLRFDLGAASLARDDQGRGIEDVIGALEIAFEGDRNRPYTAFGYPALPTLFHPEFDGQRLYSCPSPLTGTDNPPGGGPDTLQIDCDMTGGASGGSWVVAGNRVASVSSYGYTGDPFHLYGPYQGTTAEQLYEQASGQPVLCAGAQVTNRGGADADDFIGGAGSQTFKLAGGGDRARGGSKADRACGGGGRDELRGGGGRDELRGGPRGDTLLGGGGRDLCIGGPGRDKARGCERRVRIP